LKKMWEVHVYGDVPQCLELPAETPEAAVNEALQAVIDRLEFKAYLQGSAQATEEGPCEPVEATPPEAKKKRIAGGHAAR